MKLLLTSGGLTNTSIANALEVLVGKPRAQTRVAFIPTAAFFFNDGGEHGSMDWLANHICRIKDYCGFIDIISLADSFPDEILTRLAYADVIFVGGGNVFYLSYWMGKVGLFDALPKLLETRVYAGISAGSMIATQSLRTASQAIKSPDMFHNGNYDGLGPVGRSAGTSAKLVDFVVRPHLNQVRFPGDQAESFHAIVSDTKVPLYAIDDESAIKVEGNKIEVISEGKWELINP